MSKYFVVITKDGTEYDFNKRCNRVKYNSSSIYCMFVNETNKENGQVLKVDVLGLIPHVDIKSILLKEPTKEERAVSMIDGHVEE